MKRDKPLNELEYLKILSAVDLYNGKMSQPKILEKLSELHGINIDRGKLQYICRVMKYKMRRMNKSNPVRRVNAKQQDYNISATSRFLLSNQWNRNLAA